MSRIFVVVTRMYAYRGHENDEFVGVWKRPSYDNCGCWAVASAKRAEAQETGGSQTDFVIVLHGSDGEFSTSSMAADTTVSYLHELLSELQTSGGVPGSGSALNETQIAALKQAWHTSETEWGVVFHPHARWGADDSGEPDRSEGEYRRLVQSAFFLAGEEDNTKNLIFFRSYHRRDSEKISQLAAACVAQSQNSAPTATPGKVSEKSKGTASKPGVEQVFEEVWKDLLPAANFDLPGAKRQFAAQEKQVCAEMRDIKKSVTPYLTRREVTAKEAETLCSQLTARQEKLRVHLYDRAVGIARLTNKVGRHVPEQAGRLDALRYKISETCPSSAVAPTCIDQFCAKLQSGNFSESQQAAKAVLVMLQELHDEVEQIHAVLDRCPTGPRPAAGLTSRKDKVEFSGNQKNSIRASAARRQSENT